MYSEGMNCVAAQAAVRKRRAVELLTLDAPIFELVARSTFAFSPGAAKAPQAMNASAIEHRLEHLSPNPEESAS